MRSSIFLSIALAAVLTAGCSNETRNDPQPTSDDIRVDIQGANEW
jgi:hypothetical protein